ncbi:hypothetical protein KC343_g6758 [Hortaea werneckii]|nr:hypothetical protein KC352_g13023 [Hortaea werneckii]KAI7571345.1 hypothetical protein KC317_g1703 [Hortaea werneckii]KAI7615105.1 hypothetical protein KC346_g6633 [Hortaea werneckii]KAI7625108.1 hypothetical protein KC343_g6758 [Hortaea werneckii]KAI7665966.1 hypothetical protein KC319_g7086 [Hortaea werneckii]
MLDHPRSAAFPANKSDLPQLVISPASTGDVRTLVDIEFHAFENERANQQLSYRDYTKPEHFERAVDAYTMILAAQDQVEYLGKNSTAKEALTRNPETTADQVSLRKVTNTETGQILSFAKAEIKAYTPSELSSAADTGHEDEPPMNRDWFALNESMRRQYMGLQKHCYIGMLATLPCHQHKGAGTMLLNAICNYADEAGLEVYLEATDTAKPLYLKHGFVAVNEIRFDPARYGCFGIGKERQTIMVRGAVGEDGKRKSVKSWCEAMTEAGGHRGQSVGTS